MTRIWSDSHLLPRARAWAKPWFIIRAFTSFWAAAGSRPPIRAATFQAPFLKLASGSSSLPALAQKGFDLIFVDALAGAPQAAQGVFNPVDEDLLLFAEVSSV